MRCWSHGCLALREQASARILRRIVLLVTCYTRTLLQLYNVEDLLYGVNGLIPLFNHP